MRALLAAVLIATQPDMPAEVVHGVVLRHDGSAAGAARVELRCGDWQHTTTADVEGRFAFTGVPMTACALVARSADDASAGVSLDVPLARDARIPVILPAGLTNSSASPAEGHRLDVRSVDASEPRPGSPGATTITGLASWSSGLHATSPVARPDQWSVGATVTRPGPWGTLLQGTARVRRQTGPSTLLSDVTGVATPGSAMWSTLFDPSRPTMIWDVRLGLQKTVRLGGTDVTMFGEAYQSFQGGPTDTGAGPLPGSATPGVRSGAAGRFGLKLGF